MVETIKKEYKIIDFIIFTPKKMHYQPYKKAPRAVTGTYRPHSGMGEDFLARRLFFLLRKRLFLRNEKSKNRLSVRCQCGLFFDGLDDPTKFR